MRPSVLQVLSQDIIGGTENLVQMVAPRLAEAGVDSRVATFDRPGPVAAGMAARGIPVASLGGGRLGLARAGVRLARLLRREPVDVIEAYGFKASQILRFSMLALGVRIPLIHGVMGAHITEVLDFDEPKGRFALFVESRTRSLVDLYEVISLDAIELLAASGIEREKMVYIPNGIELSEWPMRNGTRADPPTVVCSARFTERKRQIDLVEAAAILRERGVSCRFVLAGIGPTRDRVRARVQELGVGDMVELPGVLPSDEVRRQLREAAVACLPSLWEGQPGAVIEAMATGVPVITTSTPGNREVVQDGVNGLLVPARDPRRLAGAIERILADPGAAAEMVARARRRVEESYSLDVMIERRLELYERVAATGAAGGRSPR